MMDIIEKNGDHINVKKLSEKLGVEIVEISALKGTGVDKAAEAAISAAKKKIAPAAPKFSGEVEQVLDSLRPVLSGVPADKQRWYEIKVFERDEKIGDQITYDKAAAEKIIKAAEEKMDDDSESRMMIPRASSPMRDMSLSQVFLKAVMRRRMREI